MNIPRKSENSDEKSLSPLPFKEPEGLITINLNDDTFTDFKDDVKIITETTKSNHAKMLLTLMSYLIPIIAVLTLFSFAVMILNEKEMLHSPMNLTSNDSLKDNIKSNFLDEGDIVSMCPTSRTLEDCCGIFYSSEVSDLVELCTINYVVDILLEMEINGSSREKRETNEAYRENFLAAPDEDYENSLAGPYLASISDKSKLPHIYSTSNKFPYQDIDEYENPLYYDTYQYEDNLYAAPNFNNFEEDQHNFDYTLKKSTEEKYLKNHASDIIVAEQRDSNTNIASNILFGNPQYNVPADIKNDFKVYHDGSASKLLPFNNESLPKSAILKVNASGHYQTNTDNFLKSKTLRTVKKVKEKLNNVPLATETRKVYEGIEEQVTSSTIFTKKYSVDVTTTDTNNVMNFPINNKDVKVNISNSNKFVQTQNAGTNLIVTEPDFDATLHTNLENKNDNNNNLRAHTNLSAEEENVSRLSGVSVLNTSDNMEASTFLPEKDGDEILFFPKEEKTNVEEMGRANAETDLRQKSKTDAFIIASEDAQMNQQGWTNPCFYPYPAPYVQPFIPPYRVASPFDGNHLLKVVPMNTPKIPQYIFNPTMYPYMQPSLMQPPPYVSNFIPQMENHPQHQEQHGYNNQIQVSGPGGQYYMCNPIPTPTNNIVSTPELEIRREDLYLQDLFDRIPKGFGKSNTTREAHITCPNGQQSCADGSRCITAVHICDNEVNCDDASDEQFCSCRDRVGKMRTCDGYFDCPNGEDEQGCFGCAKNEFSCDDWSRFRRSTCIPLEQRCDNIRQCGLTGKDEEDCSLLTDRVGKQPQFKISNSVGFLHRNYKGRWYPTCIGTEKWAMEVCKIEAGPSIINPKTFMMSTTEKYDGSFINILPNNDVSVVSSCIENRAAFVQCPPIYCGLRMTVKNPYRQSEVETSAEDLLNELERLPYEPEILQKPYNFTILGSDSEILQKPSNYTIHGNDDTHVESNTRVVGGKPSQPAAWPWLISIYKNGIFHCGGVLINELWVITAAHCVDRFWQYYFEVQAGMLRRFSYSPMEQQRWAALIIPHEDYDRGSLRNDIALIKMSSPARYNRYIRPICLPTETTAGRDYLQGPQAGVICTTVGWGATIEHGADPDHMREVEVPVLEHCKHPEDKHGDVICAGLSEGGKDACQGDSGGPFMCRNPNNPSQWYLAGIVSHGEGCARPHEPGVYTRVSKYVGWITENIKQETFSSRLPLQKCPGFTCKGINKCLPKKRRCDKIVDCFLGDDEMDCENHFHDVFKHIIRRQYFDAPRTAKEEENDINLTHIFDITTKKGLTETSNLMESDILSNTSMVKVEDNMKINEINDPVLSDTRSRPSEEEQYFKCKRMLQILPIGKKCNRIVDCEDGSDEQNCLCVDYIRNYNSSAICDGITDCSDISDEVDCVKCEFSEYYCRQSQMCIDISKRCDGIPHCLWKEDEWDCAALTNGVTLTLDSDLRPKLSMSGIITINRFGVWRPLCANMSDNEASIATNVCNLLGFEEYIGYHKYQVKDKPLNVTIDGFKQTDYMNELSDMCSGLYVRCSNVSLDSSVHNVYQDNVTSDVELYTSPWNAVIYADGIYRCMGTILNAQWIVTSINCFEGITTLQTNYVVALLGKGKAQLEIEGPHEQDIRITEAVQIEKSDIVLLRLEESIIFTRYVKPANLYTRRDDPRIEKCVAIGLEKNKWKYKLLVPLKNCLTGYRCFRIETSMICQNSTPWSGTIVCDFRSGWYPAAVYHEKNGHCGFSSIEQYTSISFFREKIVDAMKQAPLEVDPLYCDGFRCKLGECITKNKVCNGVPDCRGNEDEEPNLCYEMEKACHLTDVCVCPASHLKCKNNKCIPKSSFCDRINDCGDYEDEPDVCSCKEYLKVTDPSKICDGVVHCMDRTDEDTKLCPCKLNDIKCGNTSFCVSNDVICDGFQDCPNGEDEINCMALRAEDSNRTNAGEVMTRTGGIWHSGCFKMNYTATELEEICYKLGFSGRSGNQLIPPRSITNLTAPRHVIDGFSIIWIHKNPGNKLKLKIRTGNEPYVKLLPDDQCYRLFLACM